jgi:Ca-activated chloride channel family protein
LQAVPSAAQLAPRPVARHMPGFPVATIAPVTPLVPVRIVVPDARLPVQLRHVSVRTEVAGLAAATHIEFELYNPNARMLEGELQFPLAEAQSVSGFALDIDGEMRVAVPVEKARGQQVFEDVTRARVDPALLEATQGNNYKLRVYPLPANGARRVALDIEENLSPASASSGTAQPHAALAWRLPLQFGGPVGRLDVAVHVAGALPQPAQLGAASLPFQREGDGAVLAFSRDDYRGTGVLAVVLSSAAAPLVLNTQQFNDRTYFYAEVQQADASAPRAKPAAVALVWDASASGALRDHGRELALLDRYFQSLGRVRVQLTVVRDVAVPVETFEVAAGDWQALRRRLETLAYDGATNLGAMQPARNANLALLFSDGLGNYGDAPLPAPPVPLYTLNASASGDAALLRRVAERSGGAYLDLLALPTASALQQLSTRRTLLAGMHASGARELESASVFAQDGRLVIAGVLTEPEAELTLDLLGPDGRPSSRTVKLRPVPAAGAGAGGRAPEASAGIAARRWATLRSASLQADTERNRGALRRLGLEFGLVGPQTSLIVLDTVADYARYGIEPPPSLRPAWQDLMARKSTGEATAAARHVDQVARQFADRMAWWNKDFPKGEPPKPAAVRPPAGASGEQRRDAMRPDQARLQEALPPPAAPMAMPSSPSPSAMAAAPAVAGKAAGEVPGQQPAPAAIRLRAWQPDEPYARRLRNARAEDLYAIYLDERPGYATSTAFVLDAADILFERGQPQLAARVLSNLAEMNLENRQVLRILAYRLLLAGKVQEAVPVLEKVLALSPGEPQSYRDLGLALDKAGQPQRAIDMLWEVVSRPWDGRFPGIELVALAELNAIVARSPGLDTQRIDPRLLHNLPLDLRAVLAWDADNTDIDLWVIDPNGEKAFYGHQLTYQGGRMSADFTGGYGPEEFSLRRAKPGKYTVMAQFYGQRQQIVAPATTLMLKLTTGFGTPAQKDQDVILRLTGQGQDVTVGTFEVGGKP